ncbi:MAG TPA: DnaJ domain-containing protein [Allosphingosinicella sp.]|nr:DnaJ domain-containing protein [Allosphingosinicella sp.]
MQYGDTSMERPFSLYADLRVPPDAPPAAIEWAYRKLMKRHHPDHAGPDSAARAAEINAAYSVLRDAGRRACYDRRELSRHHSLCAAETQRVVRRRRVVRGASWLTAAVALGAGIPLAANWYNGGIVPQRAAAVAPPAEPVLPVAEESDPVDQVADFLARAAIGRPAPQAPPAAKPVASAPAPLARVAAAPAADAPVRMRRAAPPPAPRRAPSEPVEADFLEREGFIY